jgi:cytoskeletal protein CcmA (bactofilin family)
VVASHNKTAVIGIALLVSTVGSAATAATFRSGPQPAVAADEVIEGDLYMTGDRVTVDGLVQGDLVAAGREVIVNGTVEGDLIAAAQTVYVGGTVEDARIAGMAIKLGEGAHVSEDLFGAAFSLESDTGSLVGCSVVFAGYQALLAGTIGGMAKISAGALELAGSVMGNVDAEISGKQGAMSPANYIPSPFEMPSVDGGLKVADSARIGGRLTYTAKSEGAIAFAESIDGGVEHRPSEGEWEQGPNVASRVFGFLKKPISLLVVGLLLLWLAPACQRGLVEKLETRPLPSLGWGVLTLICFPIAAIAIILVSVPTAILLGLVRLPDLATLVIVSMLVCEGLLAASIWVPVAFLAPIAVGLAAGRWLARRTRVGVVDGGVLQLVIGLAGLAVLSAIPVIGTLIGLLVLLLGLGAVTTWVFQQSICGSQTPAENTAKRPASTR